MNEPTTAILHQSAELTAPAGSVRRSLRQRLAAALSDGVVRKGMASVFDQGIVSGTSFVTSVLIGRLCSPNELGVYYLALSIVLFLRGIQEQIVSAPYAVYCHRHKDNELAGYTGSTLMHQLVLATMTVLGLSGLAIAVTHGFGPIELSTAAWALAGAAPLMLFREYLRHLAFSRLKLRTAILLDACVATVQLGGLALLAWFDMLTVANVYLVMGTACAVAGTGWWLLRAEPFAFIASRVLPDWKSNWKFSRWALASHLVGCSTPYILPWFVAAVDGTAATGILAACTTLVGLANAFVMGLSNYLTPKAAQSYADGGVTQLRRVLRKTAVLFGTTLGGFTLVTVVAGNLVAVLVFGEQYADAGPILAVLASGLLASSFGVTAGNGLWAMEKPAANFRADVVALIATIIAAVTLTPAYGVLGAAVASLIGAAIDAGIRCWTLRQLMNEELSSGGDA